MLDTSISRAMKAAAQKVPSLEPMRAVRYEEIPPFPHLPVKKFQVEGDAFLKQSNVFN